MSSCGMIHVRGVIESDQRKSERKSAQLATSAVASSCGKADGAIMNFEPGINEASGSGIR